MAISRAMVLRIATHLAAWIPFLTAVAGSMRGDWHVVGDGAGIALQSWTVLSAHGPLVGQATQLAHGLHDPGPLQYWLLTVPVHVDPARGVFWGAALWCMAAGSLTIEATWRVFREIGGLLASGAILWIVLRFPGLATMPYWNPWFAAMFYLSALAAGWATMSGHRWWWPVLVITASVAAQAHLMFALASAALVLLALIVGLADEFRAKTGYRWAVAGLLAGIACWTAPLMQQFTSRAGNLAALLHHQGSGQRTGLAFALKTITAFTQPPPLWWRPLPRQLLDVAQLIGVRSAAFAVVILCATAGAILVASLQFRSRPVAALAAISLLAGTAALVTFSHIPVVGSSLSKLSYLVIAMFPVGVLVWATIGSAFVLTGRQVITRMRALAVARAELRGGHARAAPVWTRWAVPTAGAAAVPLILLASVPVARQTAAFPGPAQLMRTITVASQLVERALPSQRIALSVVGAPKKLAKGLVWALSSDGYQPELLSARPAGRQPMPLVTVFVRNGRIAVAVARMAASHPTAHLADVTVAVPATRR